MNNEDSNKIESEKINIIKEFLHEHYLGTIAAIITLIVALTNVYVAYYQTNSILRQEKEKNLRELIANFSTTTTKTINYTKAYRKYACDSKNSINNNKNNSNFFEIKAFDYYEKLNNIDPSYESICAMLSINFGKILKEDISKYKNSIEYFMTTPYDTTPDEKKCKINSDYQNIAEQTWQQYNHLLEKLTSDADN